jgi:hypothetical protein
LASAVREALPIRPMPLLPPSLARLGRQVLKASPDAMEPRVRKAPPDRRGHRDRRVSLAFPAPRANPDGMALQVRPAPSARRVLPDHPDLLAARRHARWPRDNQALLVRLDPKDRWGLPVPRARKVWQDIRVLKGLRAFRGREESWARPALQVLADLLDLLAPLVRWARLGLPDPRALPVRLVLSDLPALLARSVLLA